MILIKYFCKYQYRYFKQIARYLKIPQRTINQQINYNGTVVMFDINLQNFRTIHIQQARKIAKQLKLDLVLIKQGQIPQVQLKPYIHQIYKKFYLLFKKAKLTKIISLSQNVSQYDLENKKNIALKLIQKGHITIKLVGKTDTENNKLVLIKFCDMMNWKPNLSLESQGRGKEQKNFWVCEAHNENKLQLNYKSLDKKWKYLENTPYNQFKIDNIDNIEIRDQLDLVDQGEKTPEYSSKQQAYLHLLNNNNQDNSKFEQEPYIPPTKQILQKQMKEQLRLRNVQPLQDIVEEITELQQKGVQLTNLQHARLKKLNKLFKSRKRLIQ